MAVTFGSGFNITSNEPIDIRILKTKDEMKNMTAGQKLKMPDNYFCICKTDGKLYIFNKMFEKSEETGWFRSYEEVINMAEAINKALESEETKAALGTAIGKVIPDAMATAMDPEKGGDPQKIAEAMFSSEHFETTIDNKIDLAISHIEAIDGN